MNCVLDKNVIYTALDGRNPRGNDDEAPWVLFTRIEEICTPTFFLPEMLVDYLHLAWGRSRRGEWSALCQALTDLFTRWSQMEKLKTVELWDMPQLSSTTRVKDDDRPIVRTAKGTGSLLVSYDGRLVDPAREEGVIVLPPNDATTRIAR